MSEAPPEASSFCEIPIPIEYTAQQVIIYSAFIPGVCLLGAIAAAVCVVVFTRRQMRSSLNVLLAGLSVFDFILLTVSLFIYLPMIRCIQQDSIGVMCHFFWRTALVTYPLSLAAQSASVWTCVAITVDRFLAIRYPLQLRPWRTPGKATLVIFMLAIASLLYKLPAVFEVGLDECGRLVQTQLRRNEAFFQFYYAYGYILLMLALPWGLMISLNAIVLRSVHSAMKIRRAISTSQTDERRCTLMVIVMIATFIFFNLPAGLNHVLEAMHSTLAFRQELIPVANFLICLNSASNILIYSLFGKKFRRVAVQVVCPCLRQLTTQLPFTDTREAALKTNNLRSTDTLVQIQVF